MDLLFEDMQKPQDLRGVPQQSKQSGKCAGCYGIIRADAAEEHHFPLPAALGGRKTVTLCRTCHDMVDRFKTQQWGQVFEDVIEQCNRTELASVRLLIMKMAKVVAWSIQREPHLWEEDGPDQG